MLIFENVRVLSFDPASVSEPQDVAVLEPSEGGTVAAVGKNLRARFPGAAPAGSGGYLSPGLVCSHTHLYSALARGILAGIRPSKDFGQILAHLWWRLDRAVDEPILRASARAGLADAAMCGATSVVDHHASPSFIDGSLDVIREAYAEIGLRGILCYETTDRNGPEGARAGVRENLRFARKTDAESMAGRRPTVEAAIGGHALFTIGDHTLEELADATRSTGRGFHVHAAEDRYDASDSRHRYGVDLAVRMDRLGLLGPKSIIGHGLWLSRPEVELLNDRDAFLAHNARSNMNNAVGYASLLSAVRNPVLGTDGMGTDMAEEFKFAYFRHREDGGPWWPGDFLRVLDRGNLLMQRYMEGSRFGRAEAGYQADLIHWDYDPPTPLVSENLAGHLAFGLGSRFVRSVLTNGAFVVRDRVSAFDAEDIAAEGRIQGRRLWERMDALTS
ncbi:MAG TPA: putative aminohydrolase SsnA [Magnetospirillaceae bacterium]|nr:putative aminohydrolase SsnA [Magnetospirillaceae bacterium]